MLHSNRSVETRSVSSRSAVQALMCKLALYLRFEDLDGKNDSEKSLDVELITVETPSER